MINYLDKNGLLFLWEKIKSWGDSKFLKITGGNVTGSIAMGGNKITNLGSPTSDTDAVNKQYLDEVLNGAGDEGPNFNLYYWKRRSKVMTFLSAVASKFIHTGETVNEYSFAYYSSDINYDSATGKVSLKEPITSITIGYSSTWLPYTEELRGKYFRISTTSSNQVLYLDNDAIIKKSTEAVGSNDRNVTATLSDGSSAVTVYYGAFVYGDWENLTSDNANAYPANGLVDDYEYELLQIPVQSSFGIGRIQTTTYIGTGGYGSGNPNVLKLSLIPKLVIVQANTSGYPGGFIWTYGITSIGSVFTDTSSGGSLKISISMIPYTDGAELRWYSSSSATRQLNVSGQTYLVIAIA